eukprot:m.93325 g.93325  ORF g.93325 m.93325 type:complete len:227 (-) comp15088_c0_seq2:169-849(-)
MSFVGLVQRQHSSGTQQHCEPWLLLLVRASRLSSGYNTRWGLCALERIFPTDAAPTLVTVFFGANDAALKDGSSTRQHVPLDEYRANLKNIVEHLRSLPSKPTVILVTPPPVDETAWARATHEKYGGEAGVPCNRTNAVTKTYAAACMEVAEELAVPCVDLHSAFETNPSWTSLLNDGLHFSNQGQDVAFKEVLAVLAQSAPALFTSEMDLPDHKEINAEQPSLSF